MDLLLYACTLPIHLPSTKMNENNNKKYNHISTYLLSIREFEVKYIYSCN